MNRKERKKRAPLRLARATCGERKALRRSEEVARHEERYLEYNDFLNLIAK